ncbi:MAG TPA: DNA-3-methyladenine glycosylase [Candidatus Saccharimonadales bacterium]|jgi:DNA-3-methyladenine glycosylase|nr:DNA-3-methyladenine glycosylase [Candidatus Saccharimonadales bacterium]
MQDASFLSGDVLEVAPRLLGCELVRELDGHRLRGKIVEVEAYDQSDPASHSFRGPSLRNQVMFGPPGFSYVYFTYGMHYCMNIVTGREGHASAVLIRAIEPLEGIEYMRENRHGISNDHQLTNGPAKLCQALGIDKQLNGHDLRQQPLHLTVNAAVPQTAVVQTTRIGISKAADQPWRFYLRGNPFVSKI